MSDTLNGMPYSGKNRRSYPREETQIHAALSKLGVDINNQESIDDFVATYKWMQRLRRVAEGSAWAAWKTIMGVAILTLLYYAGKAFHIDLKLGGE